MRELSIQEIFKVIPLSSTTREKLLAEYESYNENKKFAVSKICCDAFDRLFNELKLIKEQELTADVIQGKKQMNPSFENDVATAAWQTIEGMLSGKYEETNKLQAVRIELERLIGQQTSLVNKT